jgi:methionyl-tRNA formyltransferase
MIKIVCMIRKDPAFIYFVNRINEKHKISLVVVESPPLKNRLVKKISSNGFSGVTEALRNKLSKRMKRRIYIRDYNRYFHDMWGSIDANIPILNVDHINSQIVYQRLKQEQSDLILVHGTSIVKDHILETSDLALNLHRGLSPYYRGTYCTERALINWDPYNIGVTIHKMTRIIDGGSILAQKRPIIKSGDTVHSIDAQLTKLGTELLIQAIDKIESGKQLRFKKQDVSLGFLTLNRHWTNYLRKQILHIERSNLIQQMLKRPARKERLPIVDLEVPTSGENHLSPSKVENMNF